MLNNTMQNYKSTSKMYLRCPIFITTGSKVIARDIKFYLFYIRIDTKPLYSVFFSGLVVEFGFITESHNSEKIYPKINGRKVHKSS